MNFLYLVDSTWLLVRILPVVMILFSFNTETSISRREKLFLMVSTATSVRGNNDKLFIFGRCCMVICEYSAICNDAFSR